MLMFRTHFRNSTYFIVVAMNILNKQPRAVDMMWGVVVYLGTGGGAKTHWRRGGWGGTSVSVTVRSKLNMSN